MSGDERKKARETESLMTGEAAVKLCVVYKIKRYSTIKGSKAINLIKSGRL